MAAICVRGLVKDFGAVRALDHLDLEVPDGSVFGFVGPNGAGKTTTIQILLGLTHPTAGDVTVLGRRARRGQPGDARWRRHLGFLPQDPVFPPQHTVREVLALVGDLHGMAPSEAARRGQELLEAFRLAEAARRKVAVLSRGMKQRLGLAAALLPQPSLLILDEPVSALDPEGRRQVLRLMSELRGSSTVFFSSHILADVERVCDRVAVVHRGRKVVDESVPALLERLAPPTYRVRARPAEEAARVAASVEGVSDVTRDDNGAIWVIPRPGEFERLPERLVPSLVRAGVVLLELAPTRIDLESAFFQLLGQDGGLSEALARPTQGSDETRHGAGGTAQDDGGEGDAG